MDNMTGLPEMNNMERLPEIAAYRRTLNNTERMKVDYILANVDGVILDDIKLVIKSEVSLAQIMAAVEKIRSTESTEENTEEITLLDEKDNSITVRVSPEQSQRIRDMPTDRVNALARRLMSEQESKEREARAQERKRERAEEKAEEAAEDTAEVTYGWRVTGWYVGDGKPRTVESDKLHLRITKIRAMMGLVCTLPSCRQTIKEDETCLRFEDTDPPLTNPVYHHVGCLPPHALFAPARDLLGLDTSLNAQGLKTPSGIAQRLGITRDDLEQAESRTRRGLSKNVIVHHTAPKGAETVYTLHEDGTVSTRRF